MDVGSFILGSLKTLLFQLGNALISLLIDVISPNILCVEESIL